uniref:(northern house mosquito) hypothetical protein n=1 Tax=Culex pipiens TaxID=7175 RepID=A0A8D8HV09_CULPI
MTISGTDSGIIATDSGTVSGVSLTSMKGIDSSREASCFSSTTVSITEGISLTSSTTASATSSSASTSKNSSSPLETEIVSRNSSSTKLLSDCSCSSGTGVIIGGVSIRNSSFSSSRPLSKKRTLNDRFRTCADLHLLNLRNFRTRRINLHRRLLRLHPP